MSRVRVGIAVPPGTIDNALRTIYQKSPATQAACARGEHLHMTGRKTCPYCGADL